MVALPSKNLQPTSNTRVPLGGGRYVDTNTLAGIARASQTPLTDAQKAYGPSGNQEISRQATSRLTAQLPNMQNRGGGGGGGGGGGDFPPPPGLPVPPRGPRLEDFAIPDFRDPEYNAQIASLNRALQDFETETQQRAERYGQDFTTGLRGLGFRPKGDVGFGDIVERSARPQAEAGPQARGLAAVEEPIFDPEVQGQWDLEGMFSPYSSAARGTRGLRDEFAARGTLRSSDFGQTFGDFQNRLQEQFDAMERGRSRFGEDLTAGLTGQRSRTEEQRGAAERAAQQRAATAQMNAFLRAMGG